MPDPRVRKVAVRGLALWGIVALVGWCARPPELAPAEVRTMAGRFRFDRQTFPRLHGDSRTYRAVNPKLQNIVAWVSSVGAGVALGDLDGDGLSNDACLVDPRSDDVIVAPVPGTGARYAPFGLDVTPLHYDPSTMAPMGCIMVDLNEDGLNDLVVYYWGRTPVAFLRRPTEATFALSQASFVTQELVPGEERWYTNAGLAADLDGDGHADLIFGNYFPDGAVVLGANGQVEMQESMSHAGNGGSKPILLWRSATSGETPSVSFDKDLSAPGGGWTLALAACDIDGDLLPDLYVANDFGPDLMLHNESTPGHLRFRSLRGRRWWTTPKSKVVGQDSFKGMGVDCADLNGDGLPDFMVSDITDSYALEESNLVYLSTGQKALIQSGIAPYREGGESLGLARSGWAWDVRFGDFDNSGSPEIVQATGFVKGSTGRWPELQELAMSNDLMLRNPAHWPHFGPGDDLSGRGDHDRFFVRGQSGRYFDLAPEVGLGDVQLTRGIAVADVDGDGRLDFALATQWGDSLFFRNTSASPGAFLGLHVLLPVKEGGFRVQDGHQRGAFEASAALGARVTVFLPDGHKLVKEVDGGNGHSGKSSPDLHFGLGSPGPMAFWVAFDWRDRKGVVRHYTTSLMPGWHTVMLGSFEK
jgi:enediyne biosynthesis protein E4